MADSPITLEGVTLDEDEQAALMLVRAAEDYGVNPSFRRDVDARRRAVCDRLVNRALMYRLTGDLEPGEPRENAAYALKGPIARWLAETLLDASGLKDSEVVGLLR